MSAKTKAEAVAEIMRRREPDLVFRPHGTHTLVVLPPWTDRWQFDKLTVELTPGHELLFHIQEARTAIGNARTEKRKARHDVPGAINS